MSEQDAARARRDLYDDIPEVISSPFETWFAAWTQAGWFCTGRPSDGKKCLARCRHIKIEDFRAWDQRSMSTAQRWCGAANEDDCGDSQADILPASSPRQITSRPLSAFDRRGAEDSFLSAGD